MIRLSQKAWNNVLIVSMLLMILLFNSTTNIFTNDNDTQQLRPLLPEDSIILTFESDDLRIERIGQGWRNVSQVDIAPERISQVMQNWQTAKMRQFTGELPAYMPVVVVVWLAGQTTGQVFQLYPAGNDTLVVYQQTAYVIHNTPITQLLLQDPS